MFTLKKLPYDKKSLEPYISENTLNYHYDKHHQGYCNKLNELVSKKFTDYKNQDLEDVITGSHKNQHIVVFNNAAQVWNHTFFWESMIPGGGGKPSGKIKGLIDKQFGDYENFKAQFKEQGLAQFGSGWVFLVLNTLGELEIMKTSNADNPLISLHNRTPLLTCDVWEHAYYLDYQNRRVDYLDIFINHLVNWDFAEKNLNEEIVII